MKKEKAQSMLRHGIYMKDGDIDGYMALFNTLVSEAGFDPDNKQTLEKFTSGLLIGLFENIYQFDTPKTYQEW
jgi:hypothetical protein